MNPAAALTAFMALYGTLAIVAIAADELLPDSPLADCVARAGTAALIILGWLAGLGGLAFLWSRVATVGAVA